MVEVFMLDQRLALTRSECWLLYVWLGERAPFVRNQLAVARKGGKSGVCISTDEEGRDILAAIAASADHSTLSGGLRSLEVALSTSRAGKAG
jgi:hypothetical protein